jgi:hypothetical protein
MDCSSSVADTGLARVYPGGVAQRRELPQERGFHSGLLQERTGVPITVRRPDGSPFGCNVPADFQLSYFTLGERVTITCRVDGGANTLLSVESERYTVGADGSVEAYVYGSVSATTATSVSVTAADSTIVSCSAPAGTDLSKLPVGTSVKMHCHRIAGEFHSST